MMISDLPADLLENILDRVPVTSFKTVRSTCKSWNALLKQNRRFREETGKKSLVLMLKNNRVYRMRVNHRYVPPSIEFYGALTLKDSEQVDIATVFQCEGLLLCTTKDNRVVVWNPYLEETKWIINHETDYYKRVSSKFALGYKNNKSCIRGYKILRWWNCYKPKYQVHHAFEIYDDFSSDSWRLLDNVHLDCFIDSDTSVSLKGNAYWLASADDDDDDYNVLLCFDFTKERFKHFCLPPLQSLGELDLSVVREEQLSVLHHNSHTSNMEVWMTSNIDTDEAALLWRKTFTVDLKNHTISKSFFIHEGKQKTVYCSTINSYETSRNMVNIIRVDDDWYYIEIHDEEYINWHRPIIFKYVQSLA